MLWIAGADALGPAVRHMRGGRLTQFLGQQLKHEGWEGCHFYDLIFPLFVFMMGVSITFSLGRLVAAQGRAGAVARIFRRALLMYVLGLFFYGGFSTPIDQFRLVGVLQRLAICYFFAALFFIYLKPRGLVAVCVALLAGYWAMLTFAPVPGIGAGHFVEGQNFANWVDKRFLPGRKWYGDHDPEGLLSNLPAIASCLLGVFAGLVLRDGRRSERQKAVALAVGGAVLLAAGLLWGMQFPIIKKIWTSSYVLVAGGWSALLLAAFYLVIDVWKVRTWATPFVWIGTNALTIYLIGNVVDFEQLSLRFAGGDVAAWLNARWAGLGALVLALVGMGICTAICRFLYQRKIFLRL